MSLSCTVSPCLSGLFSDVRNAPPCAGLLSVAGFSLLLPGFLLGMGGELTTLTLTPRGAGRENYQRLPSPSGSRNGELTTLTLTLGQEQEENINNINPLTGRSRKRELTHYPSHGQEQEERLLHTVTHLGGYPEERLTTVTHLGG